MKIQKATQEDIKILSEMCLVVQALHVAIQPTVFTPPEIKEVEEFFKGRLKDPDCAIYIAMKERQPIGYIMLHVRQKPAHLFLKEQKYVDIDHIYVEENHRNQGVGRALITESINLAKRVKTKNIQLNVWDANTRAVSAFKALGFIDQRHIMVLEYPEWSEPVAGGDATR